MIAKYAYINGIEEAMKKYDLGRITVYLMQREYYGKKRKKIAKIQKRQLRQKHIMSESDEDEEEEQAEHMVMKQDYEEKN